MRQILDDTRVALRQLSRRPAFTATAVLTLALGMGVNVVAFSVVNGLLFKGSATAAQADVGRVLTTPGGDESGNASLAEYERFRDATAGALELAAEGRSTVAWRHGHSTRIAHVLFVTPNYFSMVHSDLLAGHLAIGRTGAGLPTAVIGERFWREQLDEAPLDRLTLRLNDIDVAVVGIMRHAFTGPAGLYSPDAWLPLEELPLLRSASTLTRPESRWLFVLGRLHPGASVAQVHAQLGAAAAAMAREWPDTHRGRGARFRMIAEGNSELQAVSTAAAIAMGLIGLILLLACFNVANLLLARGLERERDMGIRSALGAKPWRLMRLVMVEGCVLASLASVLAVTVAWWTRSLVGTFAIPIDVPQHIDLTPDWRVMAYVAALAIIAGVLPGIWPAVTAARVNVMRVLTAQSSATPGGRASRLGRALVAAQVAASTAFLALAVLFLQSYAALSATDAGFARDRLLVGEWSATSAPDAETGERYMTQFAARVAALPGIARVAVVDNAPFFVGYARETRVWPARGNCGAGEVASAAAPGDCPRVATYAVGPGYFETMGIPLTAGRSFTPSSGGDEVVVTPALARERWPEGGALGQTLRLGRDGRLATVVGITASTQTRGLDRDQAALFVPLSTEHFATGVTLVARTHGEPAALLRSVQEAAEAVDPNLATLSIKTMTERAAVQLWPFRTLTLMFSICGVLAIVLAVTGLAGVVTHAVNRRIREFGVRVSVGATPGALMRDVLGDAAWLLLPGLMIGLALAVTAATVGQSVFVGVDVLAPAGYALVASLEIAVVLLSCVAPALRAARVDPMTALRAD